MIPILIILLVFLLFLTLFGALGFGIGFLLHSIIPGVSLGMGMLIGIVTLGYSVEFFLRLFRTLMSYAADECEAEDAEMETIILKPIRPQRRSRRKKA